MTRRAERRSNGRPAARQRALEHRERILADLRALILARLHARVVKGKPAPFIDLLGPTMGNVAFARLKVPAVKREIEHGNELARRIAAPEG